MLGFTIAKKSELEAQATKLANAQAKADTNAKKFKTAAIIGGSTTGAAAVVAGLCFFTGGRKINRSKIKNFDSVVEERDNAITAKVAADAKISALETEKKGLESTCELLAGSAYNVQVAAVTATNGAIKGNSTFQRACYDHDLLVKKTFNAKDDAEFMKLRENLFKSFTDSITELEKLDDVEETETKENTETKTETETKETKTKENTETKTKENTETKTEENTETKTETNTETKTEENTETKTEEKK